MNKFLLGLLFAATTAFGAVVPADRAELGTPKNYIRNGGIESKQAGYVTYKDAAGLQPVDGTGGSPTHITISSSTSSPLHDSASLLITNSGSTSAQGEGASYNFSIDSADQGHIITVSMDYSLVSGTFQAGSVFGSVITDSDLEVYIYDITNAAVIQPSSYVLTCGAVVGIFCSNPVIQFQSASNSTSYRLIFHVPTTNTSAWSMKVDNITASRSIKSFGVPGTDCIAYTPTITGMGSPTNINFCHHRVGDFDDIQGTFNNGTVAASLFSISLPTGEVLDATKLGLSNATGAAGVNVGDWADGSGSSAEGKIVTAAGTSTAVVYAGTAEGAASKLVAQNGNAISSNGTLMSVKFKVPIRGWSSNVQMSDSTSDGRPIVVYYGLSANYGPGAGNHLNFDQKYVDSHNSVTTGISTWSYTFPRACNCSVKMYSQASSGSAGTTLFKNGSAVGATTTSTTGGFFQYADNWKAGDTFFFQTGAVTYLGGTGSSNITTVLVEEIGAGGQKVFPTDQISASYYCSTNQSASTSQQVNYDTMEYDTHGAVTTGASWVFKAPAAGLYNISGYSNVNTNGILYVYKNGSLYKTVGGFSNTTNQTSSFSADIRLIGGDTIQLRPNASVTFTGAALNSSTGASNIAIKRIGL